MRELDQLLVRYLESHYDALIADQKSVFQSFLTLSDPELNAYLLQGAEPPAEYRELVERLLDRTTA